MLSSHFRHETMTPTAIIDVRSPQEFAAGHLEGAVNIPYDQILQRIDSIEGVEKSSELLLYCQSGARSAIACSLLVQQGFERVMNGGAFRTLLMNFKGTIA